MFNWKRIAPWGFPSNIDIEGFTTILISNFSNLDRGYTKAFVVKFGIINNIV